jgi:penicillin-binding protein 2
MTEPTIFLSEVNERQSTFHRRAFVMGALVGAGMAALGGRLAFLQVVENDRYKMLSASNQYNFRLVLPPRGRILDRNGVEIASNRPDFKLLVVRDDVQDVDATLDAVGAKKGSASMMSTPVRVRTTSGRIESRAGDISVHLPG